MNILITSKDYNRDTGRCIYRFPSTTLISGKEVALLFAKFNNSFFNVSQALGNNTISFRIPVYTAANTYTANPTNESNGLFTLTLSDGFYSFEALNLAIQDFFIREKLYLVEAETGKYIYFATLRVNAVQYKIQLDTYCTPTQAQCTAMGWTYPGGGPAFVNPATTGSATSVMVQFVLGGISALMGIPEGTYPVSANLPVFTITATDAYATTQVGSTLGLTAPEVQTINTVIVKTNLVSSSTSYPVDMLAQVSIDALYGGSVHWSASFPMFIPTASGMLSGVELSFCDQNLNPIKFFDPDVSFTLFIRDRK